MSELLFILTIIYAAYVIYLAKTKRDEVKQNELVETKVPVSVPEATGKKEQSTMVEKVKPVVKKAKPKKSVKKPKPVKKVNSEKVKVEKGSLRNPETGEIAKIATSYRMCKRWIKDALVTEDLVERIYKASEIDDALKVKLNKALEKLAKMDKYQ